MARLLSWMGHFKFQKGMSVHIRRCLLTFLFAPFLTPKRFFSPSPSSHSNDFSFIYDEMSRVQVFLNSESSFLNQSPFTNWACITSNLGSICIFLIFTFLDFLLYRMACKINRLAKEAEAIYPYYSYKLHVKPLYVSTHIFGDLTYVTLSFYSIKSSKYASFILSY